MRDELAVPEPWGSSAIHPAGPDLLVDELPEDVLDAVVGGLTTEAAQARAAAYGQPGFPPR